MANIKSQKKRNLTNAKAAARNKAVRSYVKTVVRRVNETVEAGDKAAAVAAERVAARALDKAASKGVIHKNQAANRKSGIRKLVEKLEG
ncbi:MAG: 30S ribosomal protein S20 [Coriobacteriia bacterium]